MFAIAVGMSLIGLLIAWHFDHMSNMEEFKTFGYWWTLFNAGGFIIGAIMGNMHDMNQPAYYISTCAQWFFVTLLLLEFAKKRKKADWPDI